MSEYTTEAVADGHHMSGTSPHNQQRMVNIDGTSRDTSSAGGGCVIGDYGHDDGSGCTYVVWESWINQLKLDLLNPLLYDTFIRDNIEELKY